jgi:hypothetical protein
MAQRERSSHQSVSNLSVNFIESAFLILVENSLPVYRHNIDRKRPPVAAGENVSAAAAVMMLATGLDYHLCRLKYLRDVAKHTPVLPNTPYFNWSFGDPLSVKIQRLLPGHKESRLQRQLVELTVCRDAIVHPKFYTITHSWAGVKFSDGTMTAELPPGGGHRLKTLQHKMQRREFSRTLKLPLVPTWVSYVDAVVCILVLYRLLSFLESRYGNPYAWVGGITAYEDQTKPLFMLGIGREAIRGSSKIGRKRSFEVFHSPTKLKSRRDWAAILAFTQKRKSDSFGREPGRDVHHSI